MTAEIAILNRSAVALAADSLVTISATRGDESQSKTYVVNKLFTLSKYHPVGVMIFGSADLLGVPWETIVKVYRQQLGVRSFATIEAYCKDFITWLGTDSHLFRDKDQRYHLCIEVVKYLLSQLRAPIDAEVKKWTTRNEKIGKRQINKIATDQINKLAKAVAGRELLPLACC